MIDVVEKTKFDELKASGQLPSPRGVALQIMQLSQKPNVAIHEIVHVIKSDPALSGRIVKAANTANRAGHRPVVAIPDAVVVLGLPVVRQLALGFSLVSSYREGDCAGFDYPEFWSRCLVTAIASGALAAHSRAAPAEESFVTGLLSGVGRLALATLYPRPYSQLLAQCSGRGTNELVGLEREAFAMDHNELTAALMSDWGLPKILVDAAYFHEDPEAGRFADGSRAQIVTSSLNLAAGLGEICLASAEARRALLPRVYRVASRLAMDVDALSMLADQVVKEWQEWGPILEVPTRDTPSLAEMARAPESPAARTAPVAEASGGKEKLRLLVVEDDPATLLAIRNALVGAGHAVFTARNGREGLQVATQVSPQVVVTDWVMPELDGLSLCRALRETRQGQAVYVMLLTSFGDDERLVEAYEAGVDDFVSKPVSARTLLARLRAGQRVIRLQEETERDREEIRHFVAELAVTNRRLQQAALTDPLTEFPNRRYAMDRLEQEWSAAQRSQRPLSCMLIDVDHFKQVNDTYGHDAGDKVLRQVAEVLRQHARHSDVVARIGGEEFLVICPDTQLAQAYQCAERLRQAVHAAPLAMETLRLGLTISVGVAARDGSTLNPDGLLKVADRALYAAKQAGRNRSFSLQSRYQ